MQRRLLLMLTSVLLLAAAAPPGLSPSSPAAAPAYRQANTVAVLTVEGGIDEVTLKSLERRLQKAKAAGAQAIVIELNTPGGEVTATLNICHLIKNSMPANTVAWVNPEAYSGGTYIALACREILVAPSASFGDAAPISPGMYRMLEETERAKIESVLRSEVVDSARRYHYDEKLVQSFVSMNLELWMIENVDTGQKVFVDAEEYRVVMGEDPSQERASAANIARAATSQPATSQPVTSFITNQFDTVTPDGLRSPEEQSLQELYLKSRPSTRPRLTEDDRGKWRLVMQVDSKDELLTVRTAEALYYGLAKTTVANDAELAAYFGAANLIRFDETWSEGLVRVLMSWPVRGVLIVVFLVCLFVEIATPGVGLFGLTALVSLVLLIGTPALIGMAQWWTLVMIIVGLGLVLIELFVIPGFGITGIAGAICVLAGLVGVFVTGDLASPEGQRELWTGIGTTVVSLFAAGIGIWLLSRQIETIPLFRRFILTAEIKGRGETGFGLLETMTGAPRVVQAGDHGAAVTDLRPVGKALFGERLIEVQSTSGYIERGSPVVVVNVTEAVIEVEELRA